MKPLRTTFLALACVAGTLTLSAQNTNDYRLARVAIKAPTETKAFGDMMGLLGIDHFEMNEDGEVISEITQKDLRVLKASNYSYRVIVEDVAEELQRINSRSDNGMELGRYPMEDPNDSLSNIIKTPAAFQVKNTLGGYYSFAEMEAAINTVVATYPAIAKKESIGLSHEGRNIWVVKISDNVNTDELTEPEVLYIGLQHAREAIGGASMVFWMQYLCEQYYQDSRIKAMVDNRQIYIIVCMNPDGWEYNRTIAPNGGGGWRKNRKNTGVDLNRNWGWDWGNCAGASSSCGSSNSGAETYFGPSAFSEPETQVVRDFTLSRRLVAMIDQHSYGPYYSLPFGRPGLATNTMTTADENFYKYVPAAMGRYNGMRAGNSPEAVNYEVAGGVKDWMLMATTGGKGKIYGMTGEGGYGRQGSNTGTFWAPKDKIVYLCKGMTYQNIQLLINAGPNIDLQDASDIALSSKTGSLAFRATKVGIGSGPITVSLIPIQNMTSSGSSVTLSTAELPDYYSTYTGSINYNLPASLTNGQLVKFAWRIQAGGLTFYDTISKIYHATPSSITILSDDMEGTYSTNWASSRSVASGSTTINWGYSTVSNAGFGGTGKALTESPAGNYGHGWNHAATWKNTFNLNGSTAAYITFWVRHRAENFRDRLRVEVSKNGTTWVALRGKNTVMEPTTMEGGTINGQPSLTGIRDLWTKEVFDLSSFLSSSGSNASLQLRFNFTSNPDETSFTYRVDDGFLIDDLKIVSTTATLITLPVHFKSFTGKLQNNETIRLDWEVEADENHSHFEVERSKDGINFEKLGNGALAAPYYFIDQTPLIGNNYYRLKQFDKDGKFSYSSVVIVVYTPSVFRVEAYPNPVTEQLRVKILTAKTEQYLLSISDISGRVVHEEKIVTGNGLQEWKVGVKHLPAQLLIVTVRNSQNLVVATEKITKQ